MDLILRESFKDNENKDEQYLFERQRLTAKTNKQKTMELFNIDECNQVALPLSALIFCLLLSLYRDFEKVGKHK